MITYRVVRLEIPDRVANQVAWIPFNPLARMLMNRGLGSSADRRNTKRCTTHLKLKTDLRNLIMSAKKRFAQMIIGQEIHQRLEGKNSFYVPVSGNYGLERLYLKNMVT